MNRFRLSLLALLIFHPLHAQEPAPVTVPSPAVIFRPDAPDPIDRGLYWLYQLQYDKSYEAFDEQCKEHPDDPAGYFGKAAIDWWHLAQQFDFSLPKIQERFYRNVDITIQKSKSAAESARGNPKALALAYLYRGGAEGLRGAG